MCSSVRPARFVDEYLVDLNGTQAAIRAEYSPNGVKVTPSRLLTKSNVRALLKRRQAETAARLQVTREDVVRGLLETIALAREQGDAQAMIRAAAEINKMLGLEASEKAEAALSGGEGVDLKLLSDAELCALIASGE